MKAPSRDMMNTLSRSVLTLYSYDADPENIELSNVLRQCINLISVFPMLSVYGYHGPQTLQSGKSLYIHNPEKHLSTAENILLMLRPDKKYTPFEATILDLALVLHMGSMAAVITLPLPPMWYPPQVQILTPRSRSSGIPEGTEARRRKYQGGKYVPRYEETYQRP